MNALEVVRGTNGRIKSVKIDGTEVKVKACVVSDSVMRDGVMMPMSEVTLILDAVVSGHTE